MPGYRLGRKHRLQNLIRRQAEYSEAKREREEILRNKAERNKKKEREELQFKDEEIESSEDEYPEKVRPESPEFQEIEKTAEEKQLDMVKKYIMYLEEQELARNDKLLDADLKAKVLTELKLENLSKEGILTINVSDKLKDAFTESDCKTFKCKQHKLSVTCVVTSDEYIYSGAKEGSIIKWSLDNFKRLAFASPTYTYKDVKKYNDGVVCLTVSYNAKYVACGHKLKEAILLRNGEDLTFIRQFKGHRSCVTGLVFSNTDNHLYSCSADKTVKRWDVDEGIYLNTLYGHNEAITDIAFMHENIVATSGGIDKTLRIWKISKETQLIFDGYEGEIDCVTALSKNMLASCGLNGSICIWSIHKKFPVHTLKAAHGINPATQEPYWILCLGSYRSSDIFASGSYSGEVKIWRTLENYEVSALRTIPVKGFINSLAFSSNLNYLVLGVGQEQKSGRWEVIKEAKNSIVVINILSDDVAHQAKLAMKQKEITYAPWKLPS